MSKITIDKAVLGQAQPVQPLDCLHINKGSADEASIAYEAEYWAEMAQGKADADTRRGAVQRVGYYVRDAILRMQALAQPQPVHDYAAYKEAVSLATALFKKHFAHEEHYASGQVVWSPCDTAAGVISQIDNMVSGLIQPQPVQQEPCPECDGTGTVAGSQAHFPCPLCTSPQAAQTLSDVATQIKEEADVCIRKLEQAGLHRYQVDRLSGQVSGLMKAYDIAQAHGIKGTK